MVRLFWVGLDVRVLPYAEYSSSFVIDNCSEVVLFSCFSAHSKDCFASSSIFVAALVLKLSSRVRSSIRPIKAAMAFSMKIFVSSSLKLLMSIYNASQISVSSS